MILSFALTEKEFLSGQKTETRRDWTDRTLKCWQNAWDAGRVTHLAADCGLHRGGKIIGSFKLSRAVLRPGQTAAGKTDGRRAIQEVMSKFTLPEEDRPYTVALSAHEVHAVMKWNVAQIRRVTKLFGQEALELSAKSLSPQGTRLNHMREACMAKVKQHYDRARGLASILEK